MVWYTKKTFATMNSASAGLSSRSLAAMSENLILEYAREMVLDIQGQPNFFLDWKMHKLMKYFV